MKDFAAHSVLPKTSEADRLLAHRVDSLDAGPLVEVLTRRVPDGAGWSVEKADFAIEEYKRFLKLNFLYPSERIVPNRIVDEVWHTHILDTRKYAADCENMLGFFLHHHPYFGQRGDAAHRDSCFDTTNELYQREFGAHRAVAGNLKTQAAGCDAGDVRAAGCDAGDVHQKSKMN